MKMKGHHHGHHGPHGKHHGPHHGHNGPHHGHHGPHHGHHGLHHGHHFKLHSHDCKPKQKLLNCLHKRDHQHRTWKMHFGRPECLISQQVQGNKPEMMKQFGCHCKSVTHHFRKRCDDWTAHVHPLSHQQGDKHKHGHCHPHHGPGSGRHLHNMMDTDLASERPHHGRRCSSVPPTTSQNANVIEL